MRIARAASVLFALSFALAASPAAAQKPAKPKPAAKPKGKPKPKPTPTPTPVDAAAPAAPAAKPTQVDVSVLEVAGGHAYLEPGTKGFVRKGAVVQIRGKEYRVADATDSYSVIDVTDDSLHEKDRGRASVVEDDETAKPPPPPPRPLSTWNGAWTPERPPADAQEPAFVPLGEMSRDRRYDVRIGMSAGGYIPLPGSPGGTSMGFVSVDARVHAAPFSVPLAVDFDGSLRFWGAADLSERVGGSTRSAFLVREALVSYGRTGSWFAGLGRMRYAASTVGMLDGLRVEAPLPGGFSVGAFGGLLPSPMGGQFVWDAQRFGAEFKYSRPDAKLRPEAAVVAHASIFGGRPDERRISAMFGLYPGRQRFGGHIEVSNFDADNPWKANPVEVTAAGLDQSLRFGPVDVGARFDIIQPVRSRWLASYLPQSWFCRTIPGSGPTPQTEVCDGRSMTRAIGALDATLTVGNFSVTAGGNLMGDITHTASDPRVYGGFAAARLVRVARILRFDVAAHFSDATSVFMGTGTGGVGLTLIDDLLDVSAYYRRAQLHYAALSGYTHHDAVGGMVVLTPHPTLMLTLQTEGTGGSDANSLFVFGTAMFRPRF